MPVAQWNGTVLTLSHQERSKSATNKNINGEPDLADASNTDAFVEFERVQKSYDGETLVVKDLNLTMPKGEFLTMLGPSG